MLQKKKLLIINTVITERNGITSVIFNLLPGIGKLYDITFISINPLNKDFENFLTKLNIKIFILKRGLRNSLSYVYKLSKIAKGFDIVHAHGNSATLVLEMIAAYLANVKIRIAHSHNTKCKAKIIDKIFRPLFYRLCNGRLACGKAAGEWLYKERTFWIIKNPIDTEKFKFNREQRKLIRRKYNFNGRHIIGSVGNLNDQKNHIYLIRIFKEILKKNINARLIIVGKGPLKESLQHEIIYNDLLKYIRILDDINDTSEILSGFDLIAMPSLFEGLPLTLIEEQANGLECICSNNITKEADVTGLVDFIPLTSPVDWIRRLSQPKDIESRQNDSEFGVDCIVQNGYDINNSVEELDRLYKKFLMGTH